MRSGSTPAYHSPRSVSGVPSYSPSSSGSSAGGSSSTNTATLSISRVNSGGIRSSASATSSSNSSRVISSTRPLSGTERLYERYERPHTAHAPHTPAYQRAGL